MESRTELSNEILQLIQALSDNESGSEISSDIESEKRNLSNTCYEDSFNAGFVNESDSSDEYSRYHDIEPVSNVAFGLKIEQDDTLLPCSSSEYVTIENCLEEGKSHIRRPSEFQSAEELLANDGTVWKRGYFSNSQGTFSAPSSLHEVSGPTAYARRRVIDGNFSSSWKLFVNEKILRHIQQCTEFKARQDTQNPDWCLPLEELGAFISLLYARGALAAKGLSIQSLWNKTWGPKVFNETMSRDRFLQIMRHLRFDMKSTRSERLTSDKFALISEVWNEFIENCLLCYKPGENITVGEQLFPTRTKCRFSQYMPEKPDKFGIKFWLANDVKSKYLLNGYPYLGKDETKPSEETVGESVVYRLIEPFYNSKRTITTDTFFTSLKLLKKLKENGINCVGTVKHSKKEVPNSLKKTQNELFTSKMVVHDNVSLVAYQVGKNKNILLMSTLHPTLEVAPNKARTPEVVNFYNATKSGVNVLEQMAKKYSVKSPSRRWPVQVFFNILDLAAINAWIVYKEATGRHISRRDYVLNVAEELRKIYVSSIISLEPRVSDINAIDTSSVKRRSCQIHLCNGNKTKNACTSCKKPVCGTCTSKIVKLSICINCKT